MNKLIAGLALALVLVGCSSASSPTESAAPTTAEAEAKDVTADVKKVAGENGKSVTKAEETEPGRIVVETSLVDPRGADGSTVAKTAIKICEAVVKMDGVKKVSLMEADGTHWILFGHPMVTEGECGEV